MKRVRLVPGWKLPDDFWSVNENEPGLLNMALAFAVFVLFLLVLFTYVVMFTPLP